MRAWQRGWPSVYCAQARVLHLHRATTSRYFSKEELDRVLEHNYIRFLARAIGDRDLFHRLWRENVVRLNLTEEGARARASPRGERITPVTRHRLRMFDFSIWSTGDVAVFPGRKAPRRKPVMLVASPYLPFPLSHGAAVRIYNLMRRAARDFDQVLVAFVEEAASRSRRTARHLRGSRHRSPRREPRFAVHSAAGYRGRVRFRLASMPRCGRRWRKWRPQIAQLEFTQMAQYAPDCSPARTILVEHDITYDLYAQMLAQGEDWETRRQYERWLSI